MRFLYELITEWKLRAEEDRYEWAEAYEDAWEGLIRAIGCMAVAQELGVEP